MNIVVCGMKHCGKSTHGRFVANALNCPFWDTDDLLCDEHMERTGKNLSPREIYQQFDEEYFREIEAFVVKHLIEDNKTGTDYKVIALGGGVPNNKLLDGILEKLGFFVYLKVDKDIIFKRIKRRGLPPFMQTDNPYATFLELYREREQRYIELSDLTIALNTEYSVNKTGKFIVTKLEEALNER
ncbi:MAG: AAA family ATPase [Lentisphaerae bacterium]|nr:AAA family ATPase [Lentisphaerota bacterium]MCP4101943.1 AAA family ATPase [Lentisphaerota bacterium]